MTTVNSAETRVRRFLVFSLAALSACSVLNESRDVSGSGGASGSTGVGGSVGATGTAGTQGTAGTSGRGGTSGTAGTSGRGGTGGTAGTAGTSGRGGTGGTAGNPMCFTAANHGDLGSVTAPAAMHTGTSVIDWVLPLEAGVPGDAVDVTLFNGFGVFANGIKTGTFTLANEELNSGTCGLCVIIYDNLDAQGFYRTAYMATSGTVSLTSVASRLAGTATNLKFRHVSIDNTTQASAPHPDGCLSAIDRVMFNVPIN